MFFKSIFQGNLQFGTQKSFDKVVKMYEHRVENYYKADVHFKPEAVFHPDRLSLEIPRTVSNLLEKTWKNTVDLLEYVAQFAVSGNVGAWMTEDGKILRYAWIEPQGDKAVVHSFRKGRSLSDEPGREQDAEQALSQAIELYNKHAQAYERRGYVNFVLKKYHDAERDFSKSIVLDEGNSPAYFGRAKLKMMREDWLSAIGDLELAVKTSLALQDIHWSARRLKGECHMALDQFQEAEFEFRFWVKRALGATRGISPHLCNTLFLYGRALMELSQYEQAVEILDKVVAISDRGDLSEAELLVNRGLARKMAGKNGFVADWNAAKNLGSARAKYLLEAN